jgi:hypothetical protein
MPCSTTFHAERFLRSVWASGPISRTATCEKLACSRPSDWPQPPTQISGRSARSDRSLQSPWSSASPIGSVSNLGSRETTLPVTLTSSLA